MNDNVAPYLLDVRLSNYQLSSALTLKARKHMSVFFRAWVCRVHVNYDIKNLVEIYKQQHILCKSGAKELVTVIVTPVCF